MFRGIGRKLVIALAFGLVVPANADEAARPSAGPGSSASNPRSTPVVPTPADFDIRPSPTYVLTNPSTPAPAPAASSTNQEIPIPEPGTLALIAAGVVVFGLRWNRRSA